MNPNKSLDSDFCSASARVSSISTCAKRHLCGQFMPSIIIRGTSVVSSFWTQNECILTARNNHMKQCQCQILASLVLQPTVSWAHFYAKQHPLQTWGNILLAKCDFARLTYVANLGNPSTSKIFKQTISTGKYTYPRLRPTNIRSWPAKTVFYQEPQKRSS